MAEVICGKTIKEMSVEFLTMHRLNIVWKPKGVFYLIDITHGYYMVNFVLEANMDKVINGILFLSLWVGKN